MRTIEEMKALCSGCEERQGCCEYYGQLLEFVEWVSKYETLCNLTLSHIPKLVLLELDGVNNISAPTLWQLFLKCRGE